MTFVHTTTGIYKNLTLVGSGTDDDLSSYIKAYPSFEIGKTPGRDVIFDNYYLTFASNSTFTAVNRVMTFTDNFRWVFLSNVIINFTDVVVRRTGLKWGHDWYEDRNVTFNWTNVTYSLDSFNGRSDFFANGDNNYDFDNVTLINHGNTLNVCHFQMDGACSGLTIINKNTGGFIFEPGANEADGVQTINGLTLKGVDKIYGGQSCDGKLVIKDLDWDKTLWQIYIKNVDFVLINPKKPTGWQGYSFFERTASFLEKHTYNLSLIDEDDLPIVGAKVRLWNNVLSEILYEGTTDSNGSIPEVEVTTGELTTDPTLTTHANFKLRIMDYDHYIFPGTKALQSSPIDEQITLVKDPFVTANKAIAAAYPTQDTAVKAYSHLKAILCETFSNETETIVTLDNGRLDCRNLDLVINDGTGPATLVGNTLTLNVVGNVSYDITANTVTIADTLTTTGYIIDSVNDSEGRITLPTGYDTVTLHSDEYSANAGTIETGVPTVSNNRVRYNSTTFGGLTVYLRITNSTEYKIPLIAPQVIPSIPGVHNFIAGSFGEDAQIKLVYDKLNVILDHTKASNPAVTDP
jgi:hypothetical protein